MDQVVVAATQMSCSWDKEANVAKAEALVRQAAAKGAQIVLIQELFELPYFCIEVNEDFHALATSLDENTTVKRLQQLAKELAVVIPFSWFERSGVARYNSLVVIDADGSLMDVYRKAHIPDSDGYLEKYYFSPGDTGFKVWNTRYAKIGIAICWDQWFPEAARAMALMGAEMLFYPTAIGSEPSQPELDSAGQWQRVMQGHAAANCMPVIASNRIGVEKGVRTATEIRFFGSSFISDHTGAKVEEAGRDEEAVLVHSFDLKKIRYQREAWGLFRDRRPALYRNLLTLDGKVEH